MKLNSEMITRFIGSKITLIGLFMSLSVIGYSQCAAVAPVPNNACYNTVITNDSYCCNTFWDGICQNAYDACMLVPPPPPPCVVAPVPNNACYNTVITNDSYCCNTAWDVVCQNAYDACMGPVVGPCTSITAMIGCGASVGASMSGTGAGWSPSACGFATPGTESIFSFTATATGIHTLNVSSISGGFIDFAWVNATAGCGPAVGWNCISDVFVAGNYGAMNWVAGQTYYILLDPEGTGAYNTVFNIDCPNPGGAVTTGDCSSAQPVCTNLAFQVDPNGFGLINELCTSCTSNPAANPQATNSGCLLSGELNSTWFTVNVAASGSLEFSFGTAGTAGNCYDWLMWPYNATACANISANTLAPVSCNWNSPCDGFTGMASVAPGAGFQTNFQPTLNVTAGDQFVICFSNYSSALTSVPLNFFGSADISCTPLPVELIGFIGEAKDGFNELHWTTLSEIHNSHFEIERSGNGEDFTKVGVVEGAGNSMSELSYRFNHYGFGNQMNYYRIKQVDFNGAYRYSEIIAISNDSAEGFKIVSAYPNPTSDMFSIQMYVVDADIFNIEIRELSGKSVRSFNNQSILKGYNVVDLPVEGLAKGVYYVTVANGSNNQLETIKLVIK